MPGPGFPCRLAAVWSGAEECNSNASVWNRYGRWTALSCSRCLLGRRIYIYIYPTSWLGGILLLAWVKWTTLVCTCEDFGTLLEPVACNGNGCARLANLECLICRVEDYPFPDATLLQFFRYIPTNSAFQSETSVICTPPGPSHTTNCWRWAATQVRLKSTRRTKRRPCNIIRTRIQGRWQRQRNCSKRLGKPTWFFVILRSEQLTTMIWTTSPLGVPYVARELFASPWWFQKPRSKSSDVDLWSMS